MNLLNELDNLYEAWLFEEYADEIHCKDDLIHAVEHQLHREEFETAVTEALK